MRIIAAAILISLFGWSAAADPAPLAQPVGQPLLVVEGAVSATNAHGKAVFDREMLERLGTKAITTTTPWYTGAVTFEGVPARLIMSAVGASGDSVIAIALNDYRAEIPMEDFTQHDVILALKRDGEYMPISDKGPIFIVYPYDQDPNLHAQKYYSRSVWQLSRLIVK